MTIYFYRAKEKPYGCFSNFAEYGFYLDNHWWCTSEHYYQSHKFITSEPDWATEIRQSQTAKEAATLGRDRTHLVRPDWDQIKDEIMYRAVLAKFQTHREIKDILLATGEELIVENSPVDYYWGCGADGTGQNRLGKILMNVRSFLRMEIKSKG